MPCPQVRSRVPSRREVSRRSRLGAAGTLALVLLGTQACGGSGGGGLAGRRGSGPTILSSSATIFRAAVTFGTPAFATVEAKGQTFTRVDSPGCRPGAANDGEPGVPTLTRLLAVPLGARAVVSDVRPVVSGVRSLLLLPFQVQEGDYAPAFDVPGPIPRDQEGWTPPFAYNPEAYAGSMAYPGDPVRLSPVSSGRDLGLAVLAIAAGRYVPTTREFTLYSGLEFTVTFQGGGERFLPNVAHNPFEEGSVAAKASAWNQAAVEAEPSFTPPPYGAPGEELLILTHPTYRSAADRLAAHKNSRGILTSVVTVNDGGAAAGPDTKEEIKTFLDDRVDACLVRFSYLLLLGDAQDIEPWVLPRQCKPGDFPSDFPYVQFHTDPMADDLIPDAAVGRIAVDSLAEADVVVDKIVQYETDPPVVFGNASFYGRAAIASYFQPGEGGVPPYVENLRRFVQDSEEVRGHLVKHDFTVDRIYAADLPLTAETTPRFYRDGVTPLPPPLRPEDAFPWDGDTQAIVDAFNAGKSLFFHADHGGGEGWAIHTSSPPTSPPSSTASNSRSCSATTVRRAPSTTRAPASRSPSSGCPEAGPSG